MFSKHLRALCLGAAFWTALGCDPATVIKPDPTPQEPSVTTGSDDLMFTDRMLTMQKQLRLVASKAICNDEVRLAMKALEAECFSNLKDAPTLIENTCPEIPLIIGEIDPKRRFLWIMRDVPHVAIYLRGDADNPISARRLARLRWLMAPPWLPFSKVLIIGHSGADEKDNGEAAFKRAETVRKALMEMELPHGSRKVRFDKRRILPISYNFPLRSPTSSNAKANRENELVDLLNRLNRNIIPQADMPIEDEPTDINRGVWVFLVDC